MIYFFSIGFGRVFWFLKARKWKEEVEEKEKEEEEEDEEEEEGSSFCCAFVCPFLVLKCRPWGRVGPPRKQLPPVRNTRQARRATL